MARTSYGATTHTVTATGSNDNSKQVSVNAWNATHNKSEAGMLGFTKQSATISTNAITAAGTLPHLEVARLEGVGGVVSMPALGSFVKKFGK